MIMEDKSMAAAVTSDPKATTEIETDKSSNNYRKPKRSYYNLLALIGFLSGGIAGLFGLALSVIAWFSTTNVQKSLSFWGTILVAVTIPLLGLGAHALDKADYIVSEQERLEREKRRIDELGEIG